MKKHTNNNETTAVLIDQDAEMEKIVQAAQWHARRRQDARWWCGLNPGQRYEEVSAVEEKQHVCQHTTNVTLYWPTTWEARLFVMTTRCATSSKWHSSFGTGVWRMHTHIHTHTFCNTPAERFDLRGGFPLYTVATQPDLTVSVKYGWCVMKSTSYFSFFFFFQPGSILWLLALWIQWGWSLLVDTDPASASYRSCSQCGLCYYIRYGRAFIEGGES